MQVFIRCFRTIVSLCMLCSFLSLVACGVAPVDTPHDVPPPGGGKHPTDVQQPAPPPDPGPTNPGRPTSPPDDRNTPPTSGFVGVGEACQDPIDPGMCRNEGVIRFAWDKTKGRCVAYREHCGKGRNKFETMAACRQLCPSSNGACFDGNRSFADGDSFIASDRCNTCTCKQGKVTCTNHKCEKIPTACTYPVDRGPCKAIFKMFYYDTKSHTCKPFGYGGCEGNDNRFKTKAACEAKCL